MLTDHCLMSSSSHFQESTEKPVARESTGENPVALFSNRRKSSQEARSVREDFSVPGNNEPLNSMKSFLEEFKDCTLAEAKI